MFSVVITTYFNSKRRKPRSCLWNTSDTFRLGADHADCSSVKAMIMSLKHVVVFNQKMNKNKTSLSPAGWKKLNILCINQCINQPVDSLAICRFRWNSAPATSDMCWSCACNLLEKGRQFSYTSLALNQEWSHCLFSKHFLSAIWALSSEFCFCSANQSQKTIKV